ncbi:MAG TPA: GFA family protein [Kofleriaceae bacterium]|jgi:hypothetical protein|nr:GFA family protein [Kofleriaceae bacterium]
MSEDTYKGRCFCGAVEITVTGQPLGMGYCHCTSCREWSASPVNAFTLWATAAVKVTKGESNLLSYTKTKGTDRKWCKTCGGHVLTAHPPWGPPGGLVDVYAATIPTFPFKAGIHVNYPERVLPAMKDGLPKMKDYPADLGGSGVTVPE